MKWYPFQLQIEHHLSRPLSLHLRFAGPLSQVSGIGRGELQQLLQSRNGIRMQSVLLSKDGGQRRDGGALIGETARIGIAVGAIATQVGKR